MTKQIFLNNFDWQFIAPVKASATTGTPDVELGYGIVQISQAASAFLANPTGGDWYVLTAYKRSGSVESQVEVIKVLGVDEAGYSAAGECRLRVTRGTEGTVPQAYVAGDYISMRLTKSGVANLLQASDNLASLTDTTIARTSLGLGNVDNTLDANKPVSTAQATAIALKEATANKDATGGYAGLTLFKLNLKNAANTVTSWFTNTNTVARTYTLPDKDGTVAMVSDITGTNSGTNTGDNAANTLYASDYRAANFAAGTNYSAPTGVETLTNKTLVTPGINGYTEGVVVANTGTAYALNIASASIQNLTLTGNCTYTFPNAAAGKSFLLVQKQDATGSRTVTWPATVKWPGSTAPTLTATANKADLFGFTCDGSNWFGRAMGSAYL